MDSIKNPSFCEEKKMADMNDLNELIFKIILTKFNLISRKR
ncbi:hypothetical protein A3Q56_07854 [Intoshia linei]|uniref:Uncharacterized protein n=1 Tax=Intoshia linei TaxID=1819745 RepID=A0A177AQY2_9BILA|nr:hypothetical protein A3Q56_07854 [Intoshia linei]